MHLKSHPKLVRSELRLDVGVQTSLRTFGGNHGNNIIISGGNRLPFGVLSPNTLRSGGGVAPLRAPGRENDLTAEDGDAAADVWAVITPGHVREKIAIFASDDESGGGGRRGAPNGGSGARAAPTNHAPVTGLSRPAKAKGTREGNCGAKRRRRSGNDQQDTHKASPRRCDSGGEAVAEQKVSVVEMVAFLEQRAGHAKPLLALQRSSASITLSRAPPPEGRGAEPESVQGAEPESVRVSDMVARLESACVKRQSAGDLSRNNSLRRIVGRVLLAASGDQSSAPCPPSSPSSITSSSSDGKPIGSSERAVSAVANGSSGDETLDATETQTQAPPLSQAPPLLQTPPAPKVEPLPGLLFLLPASKPRPPPASCDSGSQSEKRRKRRKADRAQQQGPGQGADAASSPPRRVSPDFLLMRQRLQQLLAPQPFLAVLPHHVLLSILALLPTQSLAALKCTCRYFCSVIEDYGVRPADSLWVSDPRYRDDPCKQCKKRYGRGDVSLCRWHHKPYCQALPYGPGYWMCCRGARRDAPGCNVGLHDNRWVPAFHSINVPMYRRGRGGDD